jgi:GNAT superfamily N-acetyltransferase
MLPSMSARETANGVRFDPLALDRVERHFWASIWGSIAAEAKRERGIERRDFGPVQATVVGDLGQVQMLNLVLGAAELPPSGGDDLAGAIAWAESLGVTPYVPVTPGLPGTEPAESRLRASGFEPGYSWMKFVRDSHPPRFPLPDGVEVVELARAEEEPFGMIAATGFGMDAWAAAFFANLPGREGWRCYVARIDGEAQACAAMLIDGDIAEFGIAATLETARGRGCQIALLHRRILDAAAAGCHTLFVETGERIPGRPAASYRNILRAGFEEAYLRPNWQRRSD